MFLSPGSGPDRVGRNWSWGTMSTASTVRRNLSPSSLTRPDICGWTWLRAGWRLGKTIAMLKKLDRRILTYRPMHTKKVESSNCRGVGQNHQRVAWSHAFSFSEGLLWSFSRCAGSANTATTSAVPSTHRPLKFDQKVYKSYDIGLVACKSLWYNSAIWPPQIQVWGGKRTRRTNGDLNAIAICNRVRTG